MTDLTPEQLDSMRRYYGSCEMCRDTGARNEQIGVGGWCDAMCGQEECGHEEEWGPLCVDCARKPGISWFSCFGNHHAEADCPL